MKVTGAVLKYVGPIHESAGSQNEFVAFVLNLEIPDGKKRTFEFKKSNNYQCEVPTVIKFKGVRGQDVVFQENYAKALLESYGPRAEKEANRVLSFVREITEEEVNLDSFEKFAEPKPEAPAKPQKAKQKQGDYDHEAV